jgi:hypothetical protein
MQVIEDEETSVGEGELAGSHGLGHPTNESGQREVRVDDADGTSRFEGCRVVDLNSGRGPDQDLLVPLVVIQVRDESR